MAEHGSDCKRGMIMPVSLPTKARAQMARAREREPVQTVDWLGIWALSVGVCAVALAAVAYFMGGDNIGAALVLVSAVGLIGLFLRAGAARA